MWFLGQLCETLYTQFCSLRLPSSCNPDRGLVVFACMQGTESAFVQPWHNQEANLRPQPQNFPLDRPTSGRQRLGRRKGVSFCLSQSARFRARATEESKAAVITSYKWSFPCRTRHQENRVGNWVWIFIVHHINFKGKGFLMSRGLEIILQL